MGKFRILSLLHTVIGTYTMLTYVTEWLIAIQLIGEHARG